MVQSTLFDVFSSVSKAHHCFPPKPKRLLLAHGINGEIKSAHFKLEGFYPEVIFFTLEDFCCILLHLQGLQAVLLCLQHFQDCLFCQGGCSGDFQLWQAEWLRRERGYSIIKIINAKLKIYLKEGLSGDLYLHCVRKYKLVIRTEETDKVTEPST